jgi:hypothetical protein
MDNKIQFTDQLCTQIESEKDSFQQKRNEATSHSDEK